ncbi:acetyl/propionyl/methylcrotonyl-CoA carboxylase subunit alpha [Kribbella yunnanensis]|uniref:biotin carboxylase n=1 Tax=Kribbella yunnanensis TaxID=190194 RepID=A0ABN2IKC2_9ACTN
MLNKVLVANRAEIAVRVMRTCRELGIGSVAVHSEPDAGSLHVREADEAVLLPGVTAVETYLAIDRIIAAARDTGADAIHPGYGFLAENAGFARAVVEAGLTFIGPPPDAIEIMGEKTAARRVAGKADVPQVPGSSGAVESADDVEVFGKEHGYPLAIKASYGGGGRGMRVVQGPEEVADAFAAARREAEAAFGRGDVYLERYIQNARHVEVQVFADRHGNVVWLGDRDCSVQRRHQKLVEEAPAPGLSAGLRAAMGEASVRLARAVDYVGAGTVEFLVEADSERFYFLEMNTRIQVEHPVTELTLGIDLVAEQLRVAAGEPLSFAGSGPAPRGHAIEVRVNAEDVAGGAFRPSPGPVRTLSVPQRTGVRFDAGYQVGDEVLPYYDSLIGKLIIWAPSRDHAIDRALQTIGQVIIEGVPTTLPAAAVVLDHADFRAVRIGTRWLENDINLVDLLPPVSPAVSEVEAEDDGYEDDRQEVWVAGRRYLIPLPALVGAEPQPDSDVSVADGNRRARTTSGGKRDAVRRKAVGSGTVTSPMQGTVVKVNIVPGQKVSEGEVILVLEAMKMENPVRAAIDGTIASVLAQQGQSVPAGTALAEITPADA